MKLSVYVVRSFIAAALLCAASLVRAEVVDMAPASFTSTHSVEVSAPPEVVYQALTQKVGQWWSSDHTYSGDAKNLSIVAEAGGCFCEVWQNGSVEHMRITYAENNKALRMIGGLGPLQSLAVQGSMNWSLEADKKGGTRLEVIYRVGGYLKGGLESWSEPVDRVLGEQVDGLKAFIEK